MQMVLCPINNDNIVRVILGEAQSILTSGSVTHTEVTHYNKTMVGSATASPVDWNRLLLDARTE